MDELRSPFSPGAGYPPPELAGRDEILRKAEVALARVKAGRSDRSQMLLGLRGVGKTVLLNRINRMAREQGYHTIMIEAPEGRRLADMLVGPLKRTLEDLSTFERSRALATKSYSLLRSLAGAFKVTVGDWEVGFDGAGGGASSGDLEADLSELLVSVAEAAKSANGAIAILIDEVQYLSLSDLSALIVSLHKVAQNGLPLLMFGAGLPQVAALAGEAKSYAERLFSFPGVGPLNREDAIDAIRTPVVKEGAAIDDAALELIVQQTQGYPYFLQEWGATSWTTAPVSPINEDDVRRASVEALRRLDQEFFRVRFDRLTPREKDYVRAMAGLGPGSHRSGDIARELKISVQAAGPLRDGLIKKGTIYSPQHGETAFTVPMFDAFMKRAIPEFKVPEKNGSKRSREP